MVVVMVIMVMVMVMVMIVMVMVIMKIIMMIMNIIMMIMIHNTLLLSSLFYTLIRFLIGLGNPILGPSAVDAISMGCMFINPVYEVRGKKQCKKSTNGNCYDSQHPFATEQIGIPYVCIYRERNLADLKHCVQLSLNTTLRPVIPHMLRKEEYVKKLFRT